MKRDWKGRVSERENIPILKDKKETRKTIRAAYK